MQRVSEDAGTRLTPLLHEQIRFQARWLALASRRERPTCAYVSVDATGVRQQGRGATQAEGRMTYVGMLYNPPPRSQAGNQRASLPGGPLRLSGFRKTVHHEAMYVGWAKPSADRPLRRRVCLEKFLATYFPQATLILDFFHAAEHLAELTRTLDQREDAFGGSAAFSD